MLCHDSAAQSLHPDHKQHYKALAFPKTSLGSGLLEYATRLQGVRLLPSPRAQHVEREGGTQQRTIEEQDIKIATLEFFRNPGQVPFLSLQNPVLLLRGHF